jgi:hypothetical protein
MQHLNSNCREKDVENETKTEDLLLRCTEGIDVGSVAERRFYAQRSAARMQNAASRKLFKGLSCHILAALDHAAGLLTGL